MMSSAETLNFGPQWLRALSEGSSTSPTSPPAVQTTYVAKFKLAENRYGREELLALFVDDSEVPEELHRAPSLVSEFVQVPLAFRPSNEHSQPSLSTPSRGRGGVSSGLRGRSIPSRGRGRGRGVAWADNEDGPLRKPPLLRRSGSEDWRNNSLRGKGDGAEDIMGGLKEWRTAGGGQRPDFWKDTWRDRQGDANEQRYPRGRSLSSRDADDSDRRWHEDGLGDAAANSKQPDSATEPPDSGKEPTKSKNLSSGDKKEVPSKDCETSGDSPPATGVTTNVKSNTKKLPNSSSPDTVPERPLKSLEPVPETRETPETGQGGGVQRDQSPPKEKNINPILRTSINPPEDVFQKLSTNDSGDVPGKGPRIFQEVQKSEPHPTSLGGQVSQTFPFSNNSILGDTPVTSNSPIAKLQALATTWFYKDPQDDIQGPFSSTQMMEWFNAGYFTVVLLVKRACDTEFVPLGELIKRWGHVPFTSPPKSAFPNSLSTDGSASSLMQQKFAEQQQHQMQYVKLLQGQEQRRQLHQQKQQIHQQQPLQQQQIKPQPGPIGRSYQQQADFELILAKFSKRQDFCQLSPQHQQHIVLQHAEELKQQSLVDYVTRGVPIQPPITGDSLNVLNTQPSEPIQPRLDVLFLQQQKLMEEARKKEEEEIRRIQKQQEEQKEILRKQEEEFRRKKEMLMREEEQIKRLQFEAQRKKEELQRKIEEDERLKKMQEVKENERRRLLEQEERRRQQEEHDKRNAEIRRIQEEEERKRKEEDRRRLEEEARRLEVQKQEKLRKLELEIEEQKKLEERQRREEYERQLAKEAEMQSMAEAIRIQKEKRAEAKASLKKQQQEKQMQQIQLPSHAKWGHNQPPSSKNDLLSLVEIQKIEKQEEQSKLRVEARMVRENRNQVPKPKSGWGDTDQGAHGGVSLLDIQREEAKQMSLTEQTAKPEKIPVLNFNASWNKPPKILQPDVPKQQTSFWDQVVEENPKKSSPPKQNINQQQLQKNQTKQRPKGAKKVKSDEGKQIKALFQQQITKDSFTDWCEGYLRNMDVGSIDVPTFVNFLRDVESSYEVQEYVQSYLGESKEAKDFTTLFLEQRAKLGRYDYKPSSTGKSDQEPQTATARDTDGFEVVSSNTKRGKKKLRKIQKVDPSILGFSVNAASDRVNMGEIHTADD